MQTIGPVSRAYALAMVLGFATLLASCGLFDSGDESPPVTDRHRGTPDSLLQYLAISSTTPHRDLAAMASCLHPDFRFHFGAADREDRPDLFPESWPADLYGRTMEAMSARALSVSAFFAIHDTVPVMPPVSAGTRALNVVVTFAIVDTESAVVVTHMVTGLARIDFVHDPADTTQWMVTSVADHTDDPVDRGASGPLSEQTTWGRLLAHFRAPSNDADRDTAAHLVGYFTREMADPVRDPAGVAECLHPDFRFYFTSDDAATIGEEYWSRDRFMGAIGNLDQQSLSITMTTTIEDSLGSEPCETGGPSCDEYRTILQLSDVALHPSTHEVTTFRVNGRADFVITVDPANPALRVIREIRDRTDQPVSPTSAPDTESGSWGHLIALFGLR